MTAERINTTSDSMDDTWTDETPWIGQYVLDEHGEAVKASGLISWGLWMEGHREECRVGLDKIGQAEVSTIFLGLDHNFFSLGLSNKAMPPAYKPVLWETLIFCGPYDMYQMRYTSREEALEGHRKFVQMLTS